MPEIWYWYRNEYAQVAPPEWPKEGTPAGLVLTADKTSGILTDGTDDAQLTVTVVDAKGAPASNSPPVDLTIVSGPGEFPTGPSIRFENKSDIRIQDGQAAIAIRSWYAGTTVIKAGSPGLKDAEITLRFTGGQSYIEGTTPKPVVRPYVKFDRKNQPKTESTFGPNNPTFASTSAPGSAPGLATDANPATAWRPAPADSNPSIILDTEKGLAISGIHLTFPAGTNPSFRVEVSDDRTNWNPMNKPDSPAALNGTVDIPVPAGTTGRFARVSFDKADQAALAEIRVTGMVRE